MAGIYLFLGSPDVAMAEAAIGAFSVIFFIVVAEKYYRKYKKNRQLAAEGKEEKKHMEKPAKSFSWGNAIFGLLFVGGIAFLFLHFSPSMEAREYTTYLRDQFLVNAGHDVGGQNVIGAILMGYRIYDTLFEALLLVMAVTAVTQLSFFGDYAVKQGTQSVVKKDKVAFYSIRIISPLILIFGIYLIMNGHISAGGGFQGGVAVAAFFVCRYLIHNIYDLPVKKILSMEEIVFFALAVFTVLTVFIAPAVLQYETLRSETFQTIQLVSANALVGIKVACGFFVIFYRYIAVERTFE